MCVKTSQFCYIYRITYVRILLACSVFRSMLIRFSLMKVYFYRITHVTNHWQIGFFLFLIFHVITMNRWSVDVNEKKKCINAFTVLHSSFDFRFFSQSEVSKILPLLVLGMVSVIGGLCVLMLPETGNHLSDTLEEVEECIKWVCRKRKRGTHMHADLFLLSQSYRCLRYTCLIVF